MKEYDRKGCKSKGTQPNTCTVGVNRMPQFKKLPRGIEMMQLQIVSVLCKKGK